MVPAEVLRALRSEGGGGMINDEERGRVAKDIRWYVKVCKRPKWKTLCGIVLGDGDFNTAMMIRMLSRLADLIEPDTTNNASDTTKCDRDALLELAREMKFEAKESEAYFAGIYPGDVVEYADRIREALGVDDA